MSASQNGTGKTSLDFLVIGAPKAGTTSLHHYLRTHPQIYLPPEKEAPFFSHDREFRQGWDWYLRSTFDDAPPERLWGKVTPWYMAGSPKREEGVSGRPAPGEKLERVIPDRIRSVLPDVKLIAILRDPVERCISNYRMLVKHGETQRSFDETTAELLKPETLAATRVQDIPTNRYVVRGEYGRILKGYFDVFPREQILVLFSADLEREPQQVVRQVLEHIGADANFVPPNLGQRYHRGGRRLRFPWLHPGKLENRLYENERVRNLWYRVPERSRERIYKRFRRFRFRVLHWNSVPEDEVEFPIDPGTIEALRRHYEEDGRLLRELIGRELPWEQQTAGAAPAAPR